MRPFQAVNAFLKHLVLYLDLMILLLRIQKDIVQVLGDGVHTQVYPVECVGHHDGGNYWSMKKWRENDQLVVCILLDLPHSDPDEGTSEVFSRHSYGWRLLWAQTNS